MTSTHTVHCNNIFVQEPAEEAHGEGGGALHQGGGRKVRRCMVRVTFCKVTQKSKHGTHNRKKILQKILPVSTGIFFLSCRQFGSSVELVEAAASK